MIYTLIISLFIEKPFYLLRLQSFSFKIVSEFIDTFVNFLTLYPGDGAFDSLFFPEGRVFVHNDSPGGGFLPTWIRVPGGRMVLDEIDSCITINHEWVNNKHDYVSFWLIASIRHLLNRKQSKTILSCLQEGLEFSFFVWILMFWYTLKQAIIWLQCKACKS